MFIHVGTGVEAANGHTPERSLVNRKRAKKPRHDSGCRAGLESCKRRCLSNEDMETKKPNMDGGHYRWRRNFFRGVRGRSAIYFKSDRS